MRTSVEVAGNEYGSTPKYSVSSLQGYIYSQAIQLSSSFLWSLLEITFAGAAFSFLFKRGSIYRNAVYVPKCESAFYPVDTTSNHSYPSTKMSIK